VDLGDQTEITAVRPLLDVPRATSVEVEIRVAATPADLMAASWTRPGPDGALVSPIVGRFVQARVTLVSDGNATPRVEELRVVGRRCERCGASGAPCGEERRSRQGLVYLYDFEDPHGARIRDVAGRPDPLDLFVVERGPGSVARESGALTLEGGLARSARPATALIERATPAITVEAWVTPAETTTSDTARIITSSSDHSSRNFTLAQVGDAYEGRVRTTEGDANGLPEIVSPAAVRADGGVQHVALVFDGTNLMLFVDGLATGPVMRTGDHSTWDRSFQLLLGDEHVGERAWHGTIHLLAVYERALPAAEIARHHALGKDSR
jgi:hypothetical protein